MIVCEAVVIVIIFVIIVVVIIIHPPMLLQLPPLSHRARSTIALCAAVHCHHSG